MAARLPLSAQTQLRLAAIAILILLAGAAWSLCHPVTAWSLVPLAFIAYAAFRIVYELTWNRARVPTLATSLAGRRKIVELLQTAAAEKTSFSVIDLGSGRGELARAIARAVRNSDVLGIEQMRIPVMQAKAMQKLFGPANLSFKDLDFWQYDCTGADAVLLYLNQRLSHKVGEKLMKELRPGAMIVSHTFPLEGQWLPRETIEFRSPFRETIYVYAKT